MNENLRVALLIDTDNISSVHADELFERVAAYGNIIVRRGYGRSGATTFPWRKKIVLKHDIESVSLPGYAKNVADFALVIDALDLSYRQTVDVICIVSNDCDFVPLAMKLREIGIKIYGFGTNKASKHFVNACEEFVRLGSKQGESSKAQKKSAQKKPAQKKPAQKKPAQKKPAQKKPAQKKPVQKKPAQKKPAQKKPAQKKPAQKKPAQKKPAQKKPAQKKPAQKKPAQNNKNSNASVHGLKKKMEDMNKILTEAYEHCRDKDGWSHLGGVGSYLKTINPAFSAKDYGNYKTLTDLVKNLSEYEFRQSNGGMIKRKG